MLLAGVRVEPEAHPRRRPVMGESQTAEPVLADNAVVGKRVGRRSRRIVVVIVVLSALLGGAAFLTGFILDSRNYITTDNAQIDGNQISVNAPSSGTLIDWRGTLGAQLRKDAPVGRIEMQGAFVQPQMVIRAPADGVVAVDKGVEGAYVTAGTQLAIAYDGAAIYVTARVEETDVDDVRVGQVVDITVDAFPGTDLRGRVIEVTDSAAAVFSREPQPNTSGNFQKVTQVVPVRIAIESPRALPLVPGMNATVKIRRA
jgi:multidrug resistance efflux pump